MTFTHRIVYNAYTPYFKQKIHSKDLRCYNSWYTVSIRKTTQSWVGASKIEFSVSCFGREGLYLSTPPKISITEQKDRYED